MVYSTKRIIETILKNSLKDIMTYFLTMSEFRTKTKYFSETVVRSYFRHDCFKVEKTPY